MPASRSFFRWCESVGWATSKSGTSSQTQTLPACLRSTSRSWRRIGSPSALATVAIRSACSRSTSGYTTGSQHRSPAGRLVLGASSRSTDIDTEISIEETDVNAIRSCAVEAAIVGDALVRSARPGLPRRAMAELLAAFGLIFCVGGAAAEEASRHATLGLPAQAAVSGLAVMGLVYAVGHLSGAHINPAVTVAFTLTRHFPPREAIAYIAAQLAGPALAGLLLLAAWPDAPGHLGANVASVSVDTAFVYEVVLTALLMFVIAAVATDTRAVGAGAAIAIGGIVVLDILVGGGVSGASMNPARSFGPALASGTWDHFWIWIVGPVLGTSMGALAYQLVRGEPS